MKRSKGKKTPKEEEGEEVIAEGGFLDKNKAIVAGVFLLFLTVFSFSSLFGMSGSFGDGYFTFMTNTFGVYAYLAPLLFLFLSYVLSFKKIFIFHKLNTYLFGILILNVFIFLGFFKIVGRVGNGLTGQLQNSVGTIPTLFLLAIITVVILLRVFETNFSDFFKDDATETPEDVEAEAMPLENKEGIFSKIFGLFPTWSKGKENEVVVNHAQELGLQDEEEVEEEEIVESEDVRDQMYRAVSVDMNKPVKEKPSPRKAAKENIENVNKKDTEEKLRQLNEKYARPPLSMYTEDVGKASAGDNKENARIIKRTLADFGISVEMDEVTVGPTVTRYALKPAQGVKIEKIMNLANNIALELGVPSVSIIRVHERSLIGVEVPNKQKSRLGLSSLFGSSKFAERKDKLTIALGKDIYGEPVYADMTKMPHLLIAGTTGSGKSVLVHGIINSLIYNNSPYDLKFILIDPKKVELALYNNLPHLYTPVIKDPKKAVQTLNWLVQEMDRRYAVLEEFGKQNISGYHASILEKYRRAEKGANIKLPESMPYIVVVIDELADFMMKYPKEMESGIVKLAQMSRAVGIHLILATQRPSTNIITGVIKGNIPSRIALRVASQVDSRVILDAGGAEKLLGIGDLLFVNADGSDMKRIQSPNVTEEEIREVVAYLRTRYDDVVTEDLKAKDGSVVSTQNISPSGGEVNRYSSNTDFSEEDDKYEDAKSVVIQTGKTSISNLQVRLGTGYARSAKLINMLEQAGVIITTTDNSGKKVKVVAGYGGNKDSEKLEAEADKLLEENKNKEEEPEEESGGNKIAVNSSGDSGGFFRF